MSEPLTVPGDQPDQQEPDAVVLDKAVSSYMSSQGPTQLLKSTMAGAVTLKPDHEAALQAASKATGVPLDAVRADGDYVKQQAQLDGMGLDDLYATHPSTAQFLTHPANAAVAHDDVGPLKATENVLMGMKRSLLGSSLLSGLQSAAAVPFRALDALADAGGPGMSEHDYNALYAHDPVAWKQDHWMIWQANVANALQRWSAQTMADADTSAQSHLAKTYSIYANGKFTSPDQLAEFDPKRMLADVTQNLPTLVMMALLAKGAGAEGDAAAVEAEAAGADAAAAKAARIKATMNYLAKTGAVSEGAVGYAQQYNQTYQDVHDQAVAQSLTGDVKTGSDYQLLLDSGFQPEIAQAIVADRAARTAGVDAGIVDAGTNLVGGAVLGKVIGEGGKLIPRVLRGFATEGATEAVQSAGEQMGQNVGEREVDPKRPLMEGVQENALQGGIVGGLTGSTMAGVAGRAHHSTQEAQDAVANAQALTALSKVAEASKLRERDVSTFQGFIHDAAQQGPVQDVWISAEGLKQSGVDPQALIAAVPQVADQINEVQQTGGDLRVPIEQFATLPQELSQPLIPHLKTDPTGMSQVEAQQFMQSFGPELKAQVEQVLAEKQAKDALQTSTDKVRDAVLAKLTETNRFTHDVNSAYAEMAAAFYATQAQRMGTTPEDMYASHPIDIAAQGVMPGDLSTQVAQEHAELAGQPTPPQTGFPKTPDSGKTYTTRDGNTQTVPDTPSRDIADWEAALPQAGAKIGALTVRSKIDNQGSVGASFGDYIELSGVREVPFSWFNGPDVETSRTKKLREDIGESGEISPLIVAVDSHNGPYILEGAHRYDALQHAGETSFPAQVVFDNDDGYFSHDLKQDGEKGRGSFNPNTNLITLLKNADLSTFLHESGHFYIETLARLAEDPKTPQEIRDDFDAAAKYMGHEGVTPADWLKMPLDDRREGHELFARGFEAYLMEGKAPAQALRPLFQRFRSWLVSVYQQLANLRVTLNDDVRGVFDRLLASQEQIAENEKAKSFGLMPDLQGHMTPDEWENYQRLGAQATQDATDGLATKSLKDMEWLSGAKTRALRDLQRKAETKRKAVRAEVSAEVMAEPVNQARTFLKHGLLEGNEHEGPHKLSITDLKEMHEGTPEELQDWQKLGYGKYGMLADGENGLHPDHVAELFGFSSGDELVEALLNAQPAAEKIKVMTDQRMIERYGDLSSPAALETAADEALHNDARLRFVATEANALAKAAGRHRILVPAAKAFAAEIVGRLKVRELRPARFSAAETRAAKAAAVAASKGDLVEAATQKRNELINGFAARAAHDAQDEVTKAIRFFARFQNEGTRKALDATYRDQIDALLERFDLKPSTTLKEIARRKSLASFVERMTDQGTPPDIPEELLNEANRKSYKDMSMEELRGLRDSVAQIAHLGRLKNRLLAAQNARDFAGTVEDATQEVEKNAIGKPRDLTESNQIGDRVSQGVRGYFVTHRKFDSLIKRLAGFTDSSTLWNVLVRPKNEAQDREASMLHDSNIALHAIFQPIVADKLRAKKFIPEIGGSLSLEGRLAVALNWGNQTNRARVIDGDHWTEGQVAAILKTLEPKHFTFVQQLWDYLDTFRPALEAQDKKIKGTAPEWVEPSAFKVIAADGSTVGMRGGYYPIAYDPLRSAQADQHNVENTVKNALTGQMARATTKRGFLKARVETVADRPVKKQLSVIFSHVSDVVHGLAWQEYLIDATRLLGNDTLANSIRVNAGPEILRSLKNSVNAMAAGDVPAQNGFERSVNYLRSGATVAGLAWNFMTALQQPLGIMNGTARIGPKWMGQGLKRFIGDAATMQNTAAWIAAKSDFMRLRMENANFTRELHDVQGKLGAGITSDALKTVLPGEAAVKVGQGLNAVEHSFYSVIGKMQMVADIPTWLGQYEKSMSITDDEDFAIQQANQAVRDSQGAGQIGDLSEIQRGGPLMKLWTNFYSYFNVVYNQLAESVEETQLKGVKNVPAMAADVMLILILPSILGNILKKLAVGDDDLTKWPGDLAKGLLSDMFGTMVGLRDIGAAVMDGKGGPAGMRILTNTAEIATLAKRGEVGAQLWKDVNTEAGILFHYPAAQVQRTAMGIAALASGQSHNPLAILTGPAPKPR